VANPLFGKLIITSIQPTTYDEKGRQVHYIESPVQRRERLAFVKKLARLANSVRAPVHSYTCALNSSSEPFPAKVSSSTTTATRQLYPHLRHIAHHLTNRLQSTTITTVATLTITTTITRRL
jgi:hypothetical protein